MIRRSTGFVDAIAGASSGVAASPQAPTVPPHCPVDRLVLAKTSLKGRLNWTQITNRIDYERAIGAIRCVAAEQNVSMADWELSEYARP